MFIILILKLITFAIQILCLFITPLLTLHICIINLIKHIIKIFTKCNKSCENKMYNDINCYTTTNNVCLLEKNICINPKLITCEEEHLCLCMYGCQVNRKNSDNPLQLSNNLIEYITCGIYHDKKVLNILKEIANYFKNNNFLTKMMPPCLYFDISIKNLDIDNIDNIHLEFIKDTFNTGFNKLSINIDYKKKSDYIVTFIFETKLDNITNIDNINNHNNVAIINKNTRFEINNDNIDVINKLHKITNNGIMIVSDNLKESYNLCIPEIINNGILVIDYIININTIINNGYIIISNKGCINYYDITNMGLYKSIKDSTFHDGVYNKSIIYVDKLANKNSIAITCPELLQDKCSIIVGLDDKDILFKKYGFKKEYEHINSCEIFHDTFMKQFLKLYNLEKIDDNDEPYVECKSHENTTTNNVTTTICESEIIYYGSTYPQVHYNQYIYVISKKNIGYHSELSKLQSSFDNLLGKYFKLSCRIHHNDMNVYLIINTYENIIIENYNGQKLLTGANKVYIIDKVIPEDYTNISIQDGAVLYIVKNPISKLNITIDNVSSLIIDYNVENIVFKNIKNYGIFINCGIIDVETLIHNSKHTLINNGKIYTLCNITNNNDKPKIDKYGLSLLSGNLLNRGTICVNRLVASNNSIIINKYLIKITTINLVRKYKESLILKGLLEVYKIINYGKLELSGYIGKCNIRTTEIINKGIPSIILGSKNDNMDYVSINNDLIISDGKLDTIYTCGTFKVNNSKVTYYYKDEECIYMDNNKKGGTTHLIKKIRGY